MLKNVLIALTLTTLCAAVTAAPTVYENVSPDTAVIRVAYAETYGIMMRDENGEYSGVAIDFLDEIAKYTGWEYEFVDIDRDNMYAEFQNGRYDLIAGQYYFPGAEETFGYSKYNLGYSKGVLLARWDDSSTKSYELKTLNNKTIGVYQNATELKRRLKEFLSINGLNCIIKEYTFTDLQDEDNLYRFLETGEVDLLLGNTTDAMSGFRIVATFDSQPYYIATRRNDAALLEQIDSAMEKIYDSNPNFAQELTDANFGEIFSPNIILTEQEKLFIEETPVVTVSVSPLRPLFQVNENGTYTGIIPDILALISENTGINFRLLVFPTYDKAVEAVKNGTADVLGSYLYDEEKAPELGFATTAAYAKTGSSLVRNKKVGYPADGLTCGIIKGRSLSDAIQASEVAYYENISQALEDLNDGKIDLAYGLSVQIEKEIQSRHFTNIVPVSISKSYQKIYFGLLRPASTPLFTILNKSINMIDETQTEAIQNRYSASIGVGSYTLLDFIYSNPMAFGGIIISLIALLFIIFFIVYRYRLRSAKINAALEKSNAESKAQSEFLSRMSHEIRTPMNAVVGLADLTVRQKGVPENVRLNLNKISSSAHYLLNLLNDILDMSRLESGMMRVAKEPFSLDKTLSELNSMMSSEAERNGVEFVVDNRLINTQFIGDSIRLRQVLTNLIANALKFTPIEGRVSLSVTETAGEGYSDIEFSVRDNGPGIAKEDQARIFEAFEQANVSRSKTQGTGLGLTISRNIVGLMGGQLCLESEVGKGSRFFFTINMQRTIMIEKEKTKIDGKLLQGMRVLMAEDNDLNAEIAQEILQMAGAEVTRVVDGKEAVKAFSEKPELFHAILMDINMPLMNGLEATKTIRHLGVARAETVPIIAMTANTFKEDSEEAIAAGMDDFIPKPIDIDVLYSTLRRLSEG